MKEKYDAKEFIDLWNKAETLPVFLRVTGMEYYTATNRASHLRKQGYPLKNRVKAFPKEHFQKIGAMGGRNGHTGGFAAMKAQGNVEKVVAAGRKGGKTSLRGPGKMKEVVSVQKQSKGWNKLWAQIRATR
jgi:general stress protein YciG